MTPKRGERQFDKEYALTLIELSKHDYFAAQTLSKNSRTRKETALFLVQQSIEKSLKACLCHHGVPLPLVHDLGALVAKMPAKLEPPYGYDLTKFNDYAGILRYERGNEKLTARDVKAAVKIAKEVHDWVKKQIK